MDGIHDFRVALRQLRTILRCAGPIMRIEFTTSLKAELAWVDNSFARMRNAQVLMSRFNEYPDELKRIGSVESEALRSTLVQETIDFNIFLGSGRFSQLIGDLLAIEPLQILAVDGSTKVRKELKTFNKQLWKTITKRLRKNDHEDLHQLRIVAKRVRYMALATEPIVGDSIRKHGDLAAKIQKILGEYMDSIIMSELVQTEEIRAYERKSQTRILHEWDKFVISNRKRW